MAETALFGLAKSVLGALSSPALNEFKLLWDQEEELEGLRHTVTTIQAVLHDAAQRQANSAPVRSWLAWLSVVLYEADDLFDEIAFNALHEKARTGSKIGKKVRHVFSKPRRFAFTVETAHRVKAIRKRLNAIARDIQGFGFLTIQPEQYLPRTFHFEREQTHSYFPCNEVVGRNQEKEDLVKMLLLGCSEEYREGVSVIAIIGMGGLGKTTLSQLVYNDERVQCSFELHIWACINYFSPLKQALITLIENVMKTKYEAQSLENMQNDLREKIKGKKFLLVVDDVWDEDPQNWHGLKVLLDSGKPGSMVLVTTRSMEVAKSLSVVESYPLQHISDEDAWLLFKKIVMRDEGLQHDSKLENLGQEVVKKCGNVPLVIVTIASSLKHQPEKKWRSLVEGEFPIVAAGDYKKVMQALKFSYIEFPYSVKRCFSFCSLFPKDHEFEKDRLVRIWIAEGFLEPCDMSQSLEDQAEDCFFYLVDRCFFQNVKTHVKKGITTYTCQMHDLVHDLAKEVAESEIVLVDRNDDEKPWNTTLRHVSLVNNVRFFHHLERLRTFVHVNGGYVERSALNKLMSNFNALRALDLSNLGIKRVPNAIGTLIHLRFIDLSRNWMKKLPRSICNLHHLQSLVLEKCKRLQNLPVEIGALISLRHLILDGCENLSHVPPGLTALTSLVTLDLLVIQKPELEYLEHLNNLRGSLEIVIRGKSRKIVNEVAQGSCMPRERELTPLIMGFSHGKNKGEVDEQVWSKLVDMHVILKLQNCTKIVRLPQLSSFPSLKELFIENMGSVLSIESSWVLDDGRSKFFPSLETLYITDIPDLKGWWEIEPSMLPRFPHVTNVVIRDCLKLRAEYMPLFSLELEGCELENVQEGLMWHCIGCESESSLGDDTSSVLTTLNLSKISGLRSIREAQIRHLCALQNLLIVGCSDLENISFRGLLYLTSLVNLRIERCQKLRWVVDGGDEEVKTKAMWGNLTRLETLVIQNANRSCFNLLKYLTSLQELSLYDLEKDVQSVLPSTNTIEEEEEDGMPWKALQKLRKLVLRFGSEFNNQGNQQLLRGVKYLTNSLQDLILRECRELYLSWEWLLSLKHLKELRIFGVERIINIDDLAQLEYTTSPLKELEIYGGLQEWIVDIPWKSFCSLRSLNLRTISNLEAVPEGIQQLTSLQKLNIWSCKRLVSLPNGIASLSSLRYLCICGCSKELKKRCKKQTGEYWPLIQHIVDICID